MAAGIFMACLLVGLLYYLAGLGQALIFRERMQDAADSAALGGAVMAARGMNIIALLNNFMAAMLAVILTLITVHESARYTEIYTGLRCVTQPVLGLPYCIAWPGVAGTTRETGSDATTKVDQIAQQVRNAEQVATGLAQSLPEAARNKVAELGADQYVNTTTDACLVGSFAGLPVEQTDICTESRVKNHIVRLGVPPLKNSRGIRMLPLLQVYADIGVSLFRLTTDHDACRLGQAVKGGVRMGDEEFQFRVLVRGNPPFETPYRGVKVAYWRQGNPDEATAQALRSLGQTALAQAEFFYDGGSDPDEWLWSMRWTARLRRFKLPPDGFSAPCATGIAAFDDYNLDHVMVH